MAVKQHKDSFEATYRKQPSGEVCLTFPLREIDGYEWHRGPWSNEYYSYFYRRFTYHILSRLDVQDGQRILIVGCGAGFEEKNINALYTNVELWSIDISQEMIKKAIANQSPSRFALSLAEALPFPDKSFDRVESREVIEHVIDPQKMLAEISRVLKPGGVAVITTENRGSFSPKNFYDAYIRARLGRLLGYPLPVPEYKDESPSLAEMMHFMQHAGLELTEYFWDGALYTSLLSLRRYLKFQVVVWAHWFSCLENNRLIASWFCDQAKYVVRKPETAVNGQSDRIDLCYSCVRCRSALCRIEPEQYVCQGCGQIYPIIDGIPNLIQYDDTQDEVREHKMPSGGRLCQISFRVSDYLLRRAYLLVYLLCAWLCALLVKKNDKRYSHLIPADYVLLEHGTRNRMRL